MGTNKGKLKKIKAEKNATNLNQKRQRHNPAVEEARVRQSAVEERLSLNPARPEELTALERQFGKRR